MTRALRPPQGGTPPPTHADLADGSSVELRPLAEEVCRRYHLEFADDAGRYGEAGNAWCIHDNQHILNWALLSIIVDDDILVANVTWLAGVLGARSFPLSRLVRNLELAADVLLEREPTAGDAAAALLAARAVVGRA